MVADGAVRNGGARMHGVALGAHEWGVGGSTGVRGSWGSWAWAIGGECGGGLCGARGIGSVWWGAGVRDGFDAEARAIISTCGGAEGGHGGG